MSAPSNQPSSLDRYGSSSRTSFGSISGQSVLSTGESLLGDDLNDPSRSLLGHEQRGRRNSFTQRLQHLAQVGGVNSIENFTRSVQRAAAFPEATPRRPTLILSSDVEGYLEPGEYPRPTDIEQGSPDLQHRSLLRAAFDSYNQQHGIAGSEPLPEHGAPHPSGDHLQVDLAASQSHLSGKHGLEQQEVEIQHPSLPTHMVRSLGGSYGTSYGTIYSTGSRSSMENAGQIWRQQQQQQQGRQSMEGERQPIIVKEVEQDGKVVLVVAGQSTLPQTVFNSTNVLIGVGLLSLPLGMKYAGFICGTVTLLLSAIATSWTSQLLARCMDTDASLVTFADIAFISYGERARRATSVLFTLELLAACVALVVLFADTLHMLIPSINSVLWKVIAGVILIPLNFLPLRLLSFTSILGIFSCIAIVSIIFIDGFWKAQGPGSLRDPATLYMFPQNWLTLPLSFGLLMSPWGGHSVFPNIYRDMRHPQKFAKSVKITFTFTYILDAATMVAGILMFGDDVLDEVTSNIIESEGYPQWLSVALIVFIAIIPLTKVPLNGRPIVTTVEHWCGLDQPLAAHGDSMADRAQEWSRNAAKVAVKVGAIVVFVIVSILMPSFDSIMAFMGSALCFTICLILPILFYLKIFAHEIPRAERWLCYVLVVVCTILAIIGTVWAFLPKSMVGAA